MLGTNTAMADLGYWDIPGIERAGSSMSMWLRIAIFWAILLVGKAWRTGTRMAKDAEWLV